VASTADKPILRGAVIGLGMIGRHHARLLQCSTRARLAGAADPEGDRHRAVCDPALVFGSVEELLERCAVDFAIVAVPTEHHLPVVRQLAQAGVAMLIEKPLAATGAQAREIAALCERASVAAAVGHVERYNPALVEMRRRLRDGQLGRLYAISTVRSGPYSARVRDVGVVKDLATHDLDLLGWLSGSRVVSLAAQTRHLSAREHEDLVLIVGALASGALFNVVVDRVSPTKVRRTRLLGEHGALEADTLTADLTFYENGEVRVLWPARQQFRGVSEGDVIRYALRRREPLELEHEAFFDLLVGDGGAQVVSLREGAEVVVLAESVLASAREGRTVRPPEGGG